jgi:hypothetical protein
MLKFLVSSASFLLCTCALASNVNVSSPIAGSTVADPFPVTASCGVAGADAMQIYLDGTLVHSVNVTNMVHYVSASPGNHRVLVKCWVNTTSYSSPTLSFTVAKEGGTDGVPVSSPFVNATVGSPFSVIAGCNIGGADAIQIYLDSSLVYSAKATSINDKLSASPGKHRFEAKCWVGSTSYSSGSFDITVAPQTGTNQVVVSSPLPSATVGTTFSSIASCNIAGADSMQVYLDSTQVYDENVTSMNFNLTSDIGNHQFEVKCWKGNSVYSSGVYQFAVGPEGGTSQVVVSSPLTGTRAAQTFNVTGDCNVAGADAMQVYLDSALVYSPDITAINYLASASPGASHQLEVRCLAGNTVYSSGLIAIDPVDTSGNGFEGSPNIPIPPSYAYYVDNIDNLSGWTSATGATAACTYGVISSTCNPPSASYSATVGHPADPAPLAGSDNISGLFQVFNGPPWADTIWTKNLIAGANVDHFIWDMYLYVNSTNYNGSELDLVMTANGGQEFLASAVCDRPINMLKVWNNGTQAWIPEASVPCDDILTAKSWHRITFYSTANISRDTLDFLMVRIDNVDYMLNQTVSTEATGWPDGAVSVQVQLDTNASGAGVNEYLESSQVYAW